MVNDKNRSLIKRIVGFTLVTIFLAACSPEREHYPAGHEFKDCEECPEMIVVPAGEFIMGSPISELARWEREGPQHLVSILNSFAVGKFEVTRGQFSAFVSATGYNDGRPCYALAEGKWGYRVNANWYNPGFSQSDDHPVVCVSWDDARAYVSWLSRKTGQKYKLLTEAEWEYVARAGTTTPYHFGSDISVYDANITLGDSDNSKSRDVAQATKVVGGYAPNDFGLYDVHGNALEWVQDCYHRSYAGAPSQGQSWNGADCKFRVLRGGSYRNRPRLVRLAFRFMNHPSNRDSNNGFRVARELE